MNFYNGKQNLWDDWPKRGKRRLILLLGQVVYRIDIRAWKETKMRISKLIRSLAFVAIFASSFAVLAPISALAASGEPVAHGMSVRDCNAEWYHDIGGHAVCLTEGSGADVTVNGDTITAVHTPAPNGEAAISVGVRVSGLSADTDAIVLRGNPYAQAMFYSDMGSPDLTCSSANDCRAGADGVQYLMLPTHGYVEFYTGAVGAVGSTFMTMEFVSCEDIPAGATVLNTDDYARNHWNISWGPQTRC